MSPLAFFSNKAGVGNTSLVAHLAWMFAERGLTTLAVDLDPQAHLTSIFLADDRHEALCRKGQTLFSAIRPLLDPAGRLSPIHVDPIHVELIGPRLHLLAGELGLSRLEDLLAESWEKSLAGDTGAIRNLSALHQLIAQAADRIGAQVILLDLGPTLGALNRTALLTAQHLILPLTPDACALQGMENLGPSLRAWRRGWSQRTAGLSDAGVSVPAGKVTPMGYVLLRAGARDGRPVQADAPWITRIPDIYHETVLGASGPVVDPDPAQLATLRHYRSLMPLALATRKPMFLLRQADGARGAHLDAVHTCYADFLHLAGRIGDRLGIPVA